MKTLRFSAIILFFASMILPSLAQDELSNAYDWPNGIRVSYPDAWELVEEEDGVHLRTAASDMFFAFEPYNAAADVEVALENIFNASRNDAGIGFDSANILLGGLANFSAAASYFYDDTLDGNSFQRALFAIPVAETVIVQAVVIPLNGSSEIAELSVVLSILASLEYDAERVATVSVPIADIAESRYEWSSGVSIQFPANADLDWEAVEEGNVVHIINEAIDIAIYLYPFRDERLNNHAAAIRETFAAISTKDFDEEGFFFLELANDGEALGFRYEETLDGADFEQTLIALQPDEIFMAVAVVLPRSSSSLDELGGIQQVYDILATMGFE